MDLCAGFVRRRGDSVGRVDVPSRRIILSAKSYLQDADKGEVEQYLRDHVPVPSSDEPSSDEPAPDGPVADGPAAEITPAVAAVEEDLPAE